MLLWGYLVCKVKTKGLSLGDLVTFIQVDTLLLEETQLDHEGTSLLLNGKIETKNQEKTFLKIRSRSLGKKDDFLFWENFVDK